MRITFGRLVLLGLFSISALLSACSGSQAEPDIEKRSTPRPEIAKRQTEGSSQQPLPPQLRCPADSANCATARGRILYVEAVDPDGDGDAHFALASRPGITLPGITVVDVSAELRPPRLPRPGDFLSAVGPVYPGSRGQAQIEATAIRTVRRG